MSKFNVRDALTGKQVLLVTTISNGTASKSEPVQVTTMPILLDDRRVYYVQSTDHAHYGWGRGLFLEDGKRANGAREDHLEMASTKKQRAVAVFRFGNSPDLFTVSKGTREELLNYVDGQNHIQQVSPITILEWEE